MYFITYFDFFFYRVITSHNPGCKFDKLTQINPICDRLNILKHIIQYIIISIFETDIVQYASYFELMIKKIRKKLLAILIYFFILRKLI
jgi:hypothetical protein